MKEATEIGATKDGIGRNNMEATEGEEMDDAPGNVDGSIQKLAILFIMVANG